MSIPSSTIASGLGTPAAALDVTRVAELIDARFPQINSGRRKFIVEEVGHR
jgi:hypothetical protein